VIGSTSDPSDAVGINGDPTNTAMSGRGAVWTLMRSSRIAPFSQFAFIKPSIAGVFGFGSSVAVSSDGLSLAVGAIGYANNSGTVFVFDRGMRPKNCFQISYRLFFSCLGTH
jgi:hypothetical protein